jgi:hypothetical protein
MHARELSSLYNGGQCAVVSKILCDGANIHNDPVSIIIGDMKGHHKQLLYSERLRAIVSSFLSSPFRIGPLLFPRMLIAHIAKVFILHRLIVPVDP